jgi:hypothetical protein
MSEDRNTRKNPTDRLAERLQRRLLEEGLLNEEQMGRLLPKIKNGRAKPEDWKLAIDLSANPKKK